MSTDAAPQYIERRRVNIPQIDTSSHEWWEKQHDPGLSVRMLIRAEIERNGYSDVAYRPVTQQPRRGRPPASEMTTEDERHDVPASAPEAPTQVAPVSPIVRESAEPTSGSSLIDSIMNG